MTSTQPVSAAFHLCGEEVFAEGPAIKQAVLAHYPCGTPIAEIQSALEKEGFVCNSCPWILGRNGYFADDPAASGTDVPATLPNARRVVACRAARYLHHGAHLLDTIRLLVLLVPDGAERLEDVKVHFDVKGPPSFCFDTHPHFFDPIGLTVDEAQAQLKANGFLCESGERADGPYLAGWAFQECLLGGSVERVRLDLDAGGVVRDTIVLKEEQWFDSERCIWLHGDESAPEAVVRAVVCPVRLGVRYGLYASLYGTFFLIALMALPGGK
jgi:hypothetical protein